MLNIQLVLYIITIDVLKELGGGGVVIKLTYIKINPLNETFGSDYFLYHF